MTTRDRLRAPSASVAAAGHAPPSALRSGYRPEIDGLRAIAVAAVVLFHGFGVPRAGFLGVDVFFVISGFLITRIIHDSLEAGRFSVREFYARRVRRILPALLVMMLLAVPAAYLVMLPDDLENFGQSVVATVLFGNNVLLYRTSGYFELSAEFKPLIHTWSLGVEEQYYLATPLVMWAAYALGRRKGVLASVAALSLGSFAACAWLTRSDPQANFYLIFSRAWEIGAGALAALLASPAEPAGTPSRHRAAAAWLGLAAILVSLALLDARMGLPNWRALGPVLGTCLVLAFARADEGAGRLLAVRPMVFLGLISYSLYLYHQPVFAFASLLSLTEPGPLRKLLLLPLVLALAWLSWRFVEMPFRSRAATPTRGVIASSVVLATVLLGVGLTLHLTSGFYRNWPELAEGDPGFGAHQNASYNMRAFRYAGVPLAADDPRPRVLVLGNSFARDFVNVLVEHRGEGVAISYSDVGDCAYPLPPELARSARAADLVVLGSGVGTGNLPCVRRRLAELAAMRGPRVAVLGLKNFGWNNNAVMRLPPERRYAVRVSPLAEEVAYNEMARRALPAAVYVDILGVLADERGRVPVFTPDRRFISQDRRHFTRAGARYVGGLMLRHPAFRVLGPAPPAARDSAGR